MRSKFDAGAVGAIISASSVGEKGGLRMSLSRIAGVACLLLVTFGGAACSASKNGPDSGGASQPPWAWLKLSLIDTYAFTDSGYFTSCEASEEPPGLFGTVSCDTPEGRAAFYVLGSTLNIESGSAGSVHPVSGDVAATRVHHKYAGPGYGCSLLGRVVRAEPNPDASTEELLPSDVTIKSTFDGSIEGYFSVDPPET
jgi:hypothetical protein